jgi:thymidylate kinase
MMFGYPYALLSYVIMRFLGRRRTVICDRFFYQFFFDVYGDRSLGIARSFPRPDIAFVLVASPTLCLSRTRNPFDSSVGADYYARVSQMLDELSNGFGFVPIRADLDAESVNDRIVNEVLRMMNIDST